MSARTLDRRLRAEGTSFRAVLDGFRHELAERLLRDRRVSLGEAAFLLGFSDPSAFHRSFKRWTGRTPHAFRRSLA
jgi:AraC-like DNA-binding protein